MSAILNVKDENGNWIAIPAIQGEQGEKGADGKDYVLTDADKQEIADMVDVADVDLTGYATEQFVNDAIANIELPEVSGGGGEWKVLVNVTTTEDVSELSFEFEEVKEIVVSFFTQLTADSTDIGAGFWFNSTKVYEPAFYNNNYRGAAIYLFYTGETVIGFGAQTLPVSNTPVVKNYASKDSGVSSLTIKTQHQAKPNHKYQAGAQLIVMGR